MSSTPSSSEPSDELFSSFGVLLIGFIFSMILYGLTFFQTYIYFTRFPSDHFGTKVTVAVLWAVDTAATTLVSHTIYHYLVTNFTVAFDHLVTTNTFISEQALATFLVLFVQGYYASRLRMVSGKQITLPVVLSLLATGAAALKFVGVANIAHQTYFATIITTRVKLLREIGLALSLAVDLVIVGSMFFHMQPTRNPGMALPDDWYGQIAVHAFNRGIAFSVVELVSLSIFIAVPRHQGWVLLGWVASKVYVNSLLAMLNHRNARHGRGVNEEDSLTQYANDRSGSISGLVCARETSRSMQFVVNPDVKNGDPSNIIELDMVPCRLEDDDYTGKNDAELFDSSGPSKRRDYDHLDAESR